MPAALSLFLQLSATFNAVFSRILFSHGSASHVFPPVFYLSHSCSLQKSGRGPLSPPLFCPPQTQTQFSSQHTRVKDWIDFFFHQIEIFVHVSYISSQMPACQPKIPTGRTDLLIIPLLCSNPFIDLLQPSVTLK